MPIGGFPFGETPCVLYDNQGNAVQPAKSYLVGGEHVNVQPWDHAYLHQGKSYIAGYYVEDLANNGTITIVIQATGSTNLHIIFLAESEGKGTLYFLRQITSITGGTALPIYNRHGSFPDAASATCTLNPTTIIGGTPMPTIFLPGGSGGITTGVAITGRDEWVIAAGQIGAFVFTNTAGLTKDVALRVEFYESNE